MNRLMISQRVITHLVPSSIAPLLLTVLLLSSTSIQLRPAASPLPRHSVRFSPSRAALSIATTRSSSSAAGDDKSVELTIDCASGAYTMPALEIGVIEQLAGLELYERVDFLRDLCREARRLSLTTSSPTAAQTEFTTAASEPPASDYADFMRSLTKAESSSNTSPETLPFRKMEWQTPLEAAASSAEPLAAARSNEVLSPETETPFEEELPASIDERPKRQMLRSNIFNIRHRKLRKRHFCMLHLKFIIFFLGRFFYSYCIFKIDNIVIAVCLKFTI